MDPFYFFLNIKCTRNSLLTIKTFFFVLNKLVSHSWKLLWNSGILNQFNFLQLPLLTKWNKQIFYLIQNAEPSEFLPTIKFSGFSIQIHNPQILFSKDDDQRFLDVCSIPNFSAVIKSSFFFRARRFYFFFKSNVGCGRTFWKNLVKFWSRDNIWVAVVKLRIFFCNKKTFFDAKKQG